MGHVLQTNPIDLNHRILELLGICILENLEIVTKYGEISAIVVDSSVQLKGVGKYLMEFAEQLPYSGRPSLFSDLD
jgi:GNAT superfamily N-acetyltransferase